MRNWDSALALRCFEPGGVTTSNLHLDSIDSNIVIGGPVEGITGCRNIVVLGHSRNTGCSLGHHRMTAIGNSKATRWSFCYYE